MTAREQLQRARILKAIAPLRAIDKVLVYREETPDPLAQHHFAQGVRHVLHVILRRGPSMREHIEYERAIRALCRRTPKSLAVIETCEKKMPIGATLSISKGQVR